ncbi:DUF4230 domain-containing protein [Clostridium sp. AL.422]|uniref:DUF4230 domain-containing protein n=1 Tax=Clostridium TaxID=1485 RepID=UPI00293DFF3D|nr:MULTISPECIES: DUF4230 domain-containing protein [unclassified Clostridium]MDV4149541.1 DUF4230 domain-containing protein [Clostridium sp. AL.422]
MKISKAFKKIKKIIKFSCFTFILILIAILIFKISITNSKEKDNSVNITTEESIIKEVRNTSKIIPLEVELSKTITIDKSWGDLEIFHKYKRIKFFANCSFYIDLSNLKEDDIIIDENKKTLNITIPNPEIFTIDIIRDKTVYEDSSNGFLRFGEIKLTSEEFELIQKDVYKSFEMTLNEKDIYEKAISNSRLSITNLFRQIIGDDIKIDISFK